MKGLILSGGRGSRLRPITHTGPKQLIPVANKPVLEYAIEDLRDAGVSDIGIVLGNKGRDAIQRSLGDGSRFNVEITYIVQGNPLGLAHAVGCAKSFIDGDDFIVYLGDNITKYGLSELMQSFEDGPKSVSIAIQEVNTPERFGIVELDQDGNVETLVEKPDDPPSNLGLIGTFVFSSEIFDAIERIEPSDRGELEITDAIRNLLERGYDVDAVPVTGWWKDTGKPEDILDANRFILEQKDLLEHVDFKQKGKLKGRIETAEGVSIEKGAVVRGPVSIAENSTIGVGAYIGPYTSIGPDCTIQNAHIENSVVVGDTTIDTDEKIVDSLIGRGTNIYDDEDEVPEGKRLIIGENSQMKI
jgi:glucose-1-phosphate thymidylyltransferase